MSRLLPQAGPACSTQSNQSKAAQNASEYQPLQPFEAEQPRSKPSGPLAE